MAVISARQAAEDLTELTPVHIPGQPGRLARYEGLLIGGGAVLVFVVVWQLAAFRRVVPELFLPGPSDIAVAFGAYIAKGQIWNDLWVSGQELVLGFVLAIVVGLPLGMLMGWYRHLNQALDPFVTFFNAIPRVSLTPLFIIWFGIGINSKIAIIFMSSVFYPLMYGRVGVATVDVNLLKCARSFAANEAVAKRLLFAKQPAIYRVHDRPDPDRLTDLREVLESFGYELKGDLEEVPSSAFQKILKAIEGKPEERLLSDLLLRVDDIANEAEAIRAELRAVHPHDLP